jgi:hypothetical protein
VAPAPAGPPGVRARPFSGPVVPLIAERGSDSDELLGGNTRQPAADAMVTKVLVPRHGDYDWLILSQSSPD